MKEQYRDGELKKAIVRQAKKAGATLAGFASVSRWEEYGETAPLFFPQNVFPFARTVIVAGVPVLIPMLDTTPSIVYSELYNTTNRLLDEIAYRLSVFLQAKNFRTAFFPRDAYGDISVLVKHPETAFSHVLAAKYAGLGTIGYNHTLLTKDYGPRVRFVSVLTEAEVKPDAVQEKELCIRCGLCGKCCPTNAFYDMGKPIAYMNKHKCARYHQKLREQYRYPCGVCIKVCPVGKDRLIYGKYANKYMDESPALKHNPHDPQYADWTHIRSFGSKPLESNE
jgi:epoxyqueuosine reductase QueG